MRGERFARKQNETPSPERCQTMFKLDPLVQNPMCHRAVQAL